MGADTTNYSFYKPAVDETGWGTNVNDTFDDLDSLLNSYFVVTQASGSLDNEYLVAKPVTGPATSTDNAVVRWDGTSGSVVQDSSVIIDDSDNVSGVTTLTATNIAAHTLTGKLTSGSVEIEGSNFDINGGDISSGSVSGGLTWLAAQDFNDQNLTNVDIDSGDVSAITVSGGLTWSAAQNLNSQNLTNVNIDSGDISAATISGGLTWSAAQDFNNQDLTNIDIDSGSIDNTDIGAIIPATGAFTSLTADGVTQLGDGGTTDYAQIAADGEITLHGDARVISHVRISAPSWKLGVTAPVAGQVGIFPVYKFDAANDDEAHYSLIIPYRIATGSTIDVDVDWCYTGGQDNGTVCWKLDYINVAEGEAVDGGTTTITATTSGSHTTGNLIRTSLNTGITGAVAHDDIGLKLWRDISEDTLNTDASLVQTHFHFTTDKLGKSIT